MQFALSVSNKVCDKLQFPAKVAFHVVSPLTVFFPVALI